MEKISWKGHASMFGANAMWGLMSPVSKFIMAGGAVTPFVVTDLRIGGAMALFWFTSFFRKPEHVSHKDLMSLFFASLLAVVFNQGCFIFGVSLSSPGDASIITTSMPLWAMILAAFILKEPVTGKKVLGIAAGAGGALLLILGSGQKTDVPVSQSTAIWGDLLVLLAQFCYALYIVLYKDFVGKYSLVTIMKWMFTYSFVCTLPFSAGDLMDARWSSLSPADIGGLYSGRCYLYQLYACRCRAEKSPPHGSRNVQLHPAACSLRRSRMLGNGLVQPDKGDSGAPYLFGGISGNVQPEQERAGSV